MNEITNVDLKNLLEHFTKTTYGAKDEDREGNYILNRCIKLLKTDYDVVLVNNENGALSSYYPSQIPILQTDNSNNQNVDPDNSEQRLVYEGIDDPQKIFDIFDKAKNARCRTRFPVPTILYDRKYILRSSTLSVAAELAGRSSYDYFFSNRDSTASTNSEEEMDIAPELDVSNFIPEMHRQLYNKARKQDIKLLSKFKVRTIVDLMVEYKKVKYFMNVTSSEKADKEERYNRFNIISLPYPGCEFFRSFRDNNFSAEGLTFDWNQDQCTAVLTVPDSLVLQNLRIDFSRYREWDLPTMTTNYLKYILKHFQEDNSSILIHCISGWDRTPLFISLIRLSLWADGLIHHGLDEYQMLYLTIGYDWMLFGHHLCDRIDKGEEIFFFCFYFLKYLCSDEFSIAPGRPKFKKHTERILEESVNKIDSDNHPDILLEQDMKGSNLSINSIGSTVSNKSLEPTVLGHHIDETNENLPNAAGLDVRDNLPLGASTSPQARRTSPVSVPVGTRVKRTTESSAHSIGSWQIVTGTGSLKGSTSSSSVINCPATDGEGWVEVTMSVPGRKERLSKLRELFYNCYFSSIGPKCFKFGQDPSLSAIIGNMAEKVGLSQRN